MMNITDFDGDDDGKLIVQYGCHAFYKCSSDK